MLSQFYVVSPRGDTIINRDFRGDVVKGTSEIFFREVKKRGNNAQPIFNLNGINYIYIKRSGLFFVFTTNYNVDPSCVIALLQRMVKIFKDFCGALNEECIRKNFVLVYELLDEMIDFGYTQSTNTETLKTCVHNEAVVVDNSSNLHQNKQKGTFNSSVGVSTLSSSPPSLAGANQKTIPSNASHRPVGLIKNEKSTAASSIASYSAALSSFSLAGFKGVNTSHLSKQKNEIFVDILERITVVLSSNEYILNASIDGSIQMKSYLTGLPELKLALNDFHILSSNLSIFAKPEECPYRLSPGCIILDDCNFHECANLKDFEEQKILSFRPPDGEFILMNYRITQFNSIPFRIIPLLQVFSPQKIELLIKIRADIPEINYSANVLVFCAFPRLTTSVTIEKFPNNNSHNPEYSQTEGRLVWSIKKFIGGSEYSVRCKINLSQGANFNSLTKKDMGPISMQFEIPMHSVSNIQVRYLRISERHKSYNPYRWVRYVTQSASYICRI